MSKPPKSLLLASRRRNKQGSKCLSETFLGVQARHCGASRPSKQNAAKCHQNLHDWWASPKPPWLVGNFPFCSFERCQIHTNKYHNVKRLWRERLRVQLKTAFLETRRPMSMSFRRTRNIREDGPGTSGNPSL